MVRRFSIALTTMLSIGLLMLAGFRVDMPAGTIALACMGATGVGSCSTQYGSDAFGSWSQGEYDAYTKFIISGNVDEGFRAYVSSTVKRNGSVVATPSDTDSCSPFTCGTNFTLTAQVWDYVDGCEFNDNSLTVDINSTHEVEVTTGPNGPSTYYSDDSATFTCP